LMQDDVGVDDDPLRYMGWDGRELGCRSKVMLSYHCSRLIVSGKRAESCWLAD